MVTLTKRRKEAEKIFDRTKAYLLEDAIGQIEKFPKVKFDETVELHFHLNLNLENTDQGVRGTVGLPHGIGKKVRVAVFCKGELAQKAQDAGAEFVGANDLIEKVSKG